MMRTALRMTAAAALGLVLAACRTGGPDPAATAPAAHTLWQSAQCAERSANARWIDSTGTLEQVIEAAGRNQLGAEEPEIPAVDFARHRVVLVALGEQPTAGYGVALARASLAMHGRNARLPIEVTRPSADSTQAQVVTTPCMLVAVDRDGYDSLEVVDQAGEVLATLAAD